jgi:hypothetical protein
MTTSVENFATGTNGAVDTVGKFATGVVDTGSKFAAGVLKLSLTLSSDYPQEFY